MASINDLGDNCVAAADEAVQLFRQGKAELGARLLVEAAKSEGVAYLTLAKLVIEGAVMAAGQASLPGSSLSSRQQ